ncbi:MAG TPA: hypothetical protein VJ142_00235 [Candidatus Nanoarchaeia archaeon]|nr:hypothetical protein [Candidatus Nanoarchaeia archaeon]
MKKKKFILKCSDCNKEIIGFSEHHAKQNLMIHKKASIRCEEFKKLLKEKIRNENS